MNPRRLYRSRRDRQLAGVAGGIAEYLDVDPTVIRILWILSIFVGGFGILLYIIMAFIVPLEPLAGQPAHGWSAPPAGVAPSAAPDADRTPGGDAGAPGTGEAGDPTTSAFGPTWPAPGAGWQPPAEPRPGRGGLVVGVMLVVFGGIALAGVLAPGWIAWPALGPVFLVALGVALLVGATRRSTAAS